MIGNTYYLPDGRATQIEERCGIPVGDARAVILTDEARRYIKGLSVSNRGRYAPRLMVRLIQRIEALEGVPLTIAPPAPGAAPTKPAHSAHLVPRTIRRMK